MYSVEEAGVVGICIAWMRQGMRREGKERADVYRVEEAVSEWRRQGM